MVESKLDWNDLAKFVGKNWTIFLIFVLIAFGAVYFYLEYLRIPQQTIESSSSGEDVIPEDDIDTFNDDKYIEDLESILLDIMLNRHGDVENSITKINFFFSETATVIRSKGNGPDLYPVPLSVYLDDISTGVISSKFSIDRIYMDAMNSKVTKIKIRHYD